ncbi:MAG: hypothetical protein HY978_04985 [Candidatus Liptonbacteria bacterium]|nr:hypothetical protein [Candidatus Liptonbacteria bacterium]
MSSETILPDNVRPAQESPDQRYRRSAREAEERFKRRAAEALREFDKFCDYVLNLADPEEKTRRGMPDALILRMEVVKENLRLSAEDAWRKYGEEITTARALLLIPERSDAKNPK